MAIDIEIEFKIIANSTIFDTIQNGWILKVIKFKYKASQVFVLCQVSIAKIIGDESENSQYPTT